MPLRLPRTTSCLAACAVALAAAVTSAGAAPSAAATAPVARYASLRVAAPTPKPKAKAPRSTSLASRLKNRKPVTRRNRAAPAPRPDPALAAVAALPPIQPFAVEFRPGAGPGESLVVLQTAPAKSLLESMVERARSQLGTRYVLGGNAPGRGLDCSSFARFAMEALGITLPRTAAQQARVGDEVPRDHSMLRPGDLLTFGTRRRVDHVGIYLGEGRFIHASVTSGRIIETTIERNTRLFRKWLGARRLVASGDTSEARRGG